MALEGIGKLGVDDGRVQLVVFLVGRELYGVDIVKTREILRLLPIRSLPNTPPFLEGVATVRGELIPIIDLRKRFASGSAGPERDARIVVLRSEEAVDIGVIVDAVCEIAVVETADLKAAPPLLTMLDAAYLLGIAERKDGGAVAIIDTDKLLSSTERSVVNRARLLADADADTADGLP
ncbi:MAG: purine-binding chemotaxis protein CheW [Candidatus Schekmanbacteria bacterium]|nr:purine-binding chemotaxis protein CheW [Candidatus Schekmanbacteria bacterium]